MEKLINYLKRSIKLSYKSVVFHFKQYLCFYVALFIIQFIFGIIVMSTVNTNHMREKDVIEKYDYHVCVAGLNGAQRDYLIKKAYAVTTRDHSKVDTVKTEQRYVNGTQYNDIYFIFNESEGDPEDIGKWFEENALKPIKNKKFSNPGFDVNYSPLYNLSSTVARHNLICVLMLAALLLIGVVIVVLLYNIRINHFKFTYGIYMSYGADFKKLFETSFWEMFMIQLLTLLPATLAATLADWLFFFTSGYSYWFSPYMMLIAMPFTSLVAFIAVWLPIKRASVKPPLTLLLAEDNSNLVISPRLSFNMSNRRFPSSYSFFNAIRFRKYNFQIICSAIIFSAMFICSVFGSMIYSDTMNASAPEFSIAFNQHIEKVKEIQKVDEKDVTEEYIKVMGTPEAEKYFDETKYRKEGDDGDPKLKVYEFIFDEVDVPVLVGDTYTKEKGEELLSISGVTGVYKECSELAYELDTYMYMKPGKVKNDPDMLLFNNNAYTQNATYYAADKEIVDYLVKNFKYVGDPYKLSENKDPYTHYVIISNSRKNTDMLDLKPGDFITLETIGKLTAESSEPLTGNHLLQFILENSEIDLDKSYRFEVCAVIEDIATDNTYPLFISLDDYSRVTGKEAQFKNVSVYVSNNLSEKKLDNVTSEIRSWAKRYTDTEVTPLRALEERRDKLSECRFPLLISVSASLLAIAPLFWFCYQIMFYKKREKETELLRAMGGIESEIRGMFIRDGIFYACFGALFTALLGSIGTFAVYKISLLVTSGITDELNTRISFEFPWIAVCVGVLITAICGFMSSMIPYMINRKQIEKKRTEFYTGED